MNTIQKIAKNTSLLFISQIITYVISFITLTYTVRYLSLEDFGILSFALSFAGILVIFTDIGLSSLMTREIARDKSIVKEYTNNIILLKIILVIATIIFSVLLIYFLNYDKQTIEVVLLIVLSFIFNSFTLMFYSIFQAYESMEYQSLGQVLNSIVLFAGIMLAIYFQLNLLDFAMVYFITGVILTLYTIIIYRNMFSFPKISFNREFSKKLIKEALPLSVAMIFFTITYRVDAVMLAIMAGNISVGLYTASYRLMEILTFIPMVFTAAIYPVASNYYVSSHDSLKIVYKKSFEYLTMLSIPIVILVALLADQIILWIYGSQYTGSIIALQILILSIPFIFLTYVYSALMVSINKQKLLLKIVIISMILNISLNLIFIPLYGFVASAFITVLSELSDFALMFFFLSRYLYKIQISKTIFKPLIAGLIMGLFVFYLNINFLILIPLSFIFYFIILILLKTFTKEDFDIIKQLINMKSK